MNSRAYNLAHETRQKRQWLLLLNSISSYIPEALSVLGSQLALSGSRDVIGHVTIGFHLGYFLLVVI